MHHFTETIDGWVAWERVYQSIPAWEPLIRHIFEKENLPFTWVEYLNPGSNAVFKIGAYVAKIYAPPESGMDSYGDYQTEIFAVRRAKALGVCAPECVAAGRVCEKYNFDYMIMRFIEGVEFDAAAKNYTAQEKYAVGRQLRDISNKLNTACEDFNGIDAIHDPSRATRFECFLESFKAERLAWLSSYEFGEKVFVHGDLNSDNILVTPDGRLCIIDFADAVLAPMNYEYVLICELFKYERAYLEGFFGKYNIDELTDICLEGMLIHDFGGDIARLCIAPPEEITGIGVLRQRLREKITRGAS